MAQDHLELFGEQFWVVEMDNKAYSLLQQSVLHVSTLELQFHSRTSPSQSPFIILWMFIYATPDPLFMPSWEFWPGSAGEWTKTDCKFGNCRDVAKRVKDQIEVEGREVFRLKDLEVFQAKKGYESLYVANWKLSSSTKRIRS